MLFFAWVPHAAPSVAAWTHTGLSLPSYGSTVYQRPGLGWQLPARWREIALKGFEMKPLCYSTNFRRPTATEKAIRVQRHRMTMILGSQPLFVDTNVTIMYQ